MTKQNELSESDRQKLIERFAPIKPTLIVKREGVSENIVWGLNSRLASHQVVKVQFNTTVKAEVQAMAEELASKTGGTLVMVKSNMALFFKRHPNRSLSELLAAD